MNKEISSVLFKNFDVFSQSEKSINNLKSLIFQLALKGKLDFQKLSENRIKKSLKILVKEQQRNLKKEGITFEQTSESVWSMVELGDICHLYQPKTISQKEMIKEGKYDVFGANGIIGKYNKYNHEDSEVLITCRGATCGTVNLSKPKSWITGNAMVAKPLSSNMNKNYLFYLLQHSDFSSVISGAAQPQITRQKLSPFKIPLPPLEVQKEIVSLMEKCTLLEVQVKEKSQKQKKLSNSSIHFITQAQNKKEITHCWKALKNNFKDALYSENGTKEFKAMVFQLCLNGKLDFQKLSENCIKKSLKILVKEQKQYLKKEGITFEETPESVWSMVELGDICHLYQPKTISQKEMIKEGKYDVFGANGIIGKYNKYNHEDSEVLITCRGATCGTVNLSKPKSWITGNAMVAKPLSSNMNKNYLFYLLQHSDFSSVISGAAQPQITRQKLSPFKIPLPPLEVQKEIVSLMENIENIEKQIQKEKNLSVQLSQSF